MRTPEQRFWAKTKRNKYFGDCILWTGAVLTSGYGNFWADSKTITAHAFSWSQIHGPVPKGKTIMHTCDVKLCVSNAHLILGTPKLNSADMVKKGRAFTGYRPHVKPEVRKSIYAKFKAGVPIKSLAKEFGLCRRAISFTIAKMKACS